MIISDFNKISKEEWNRLVATSSTATWFQTVEAYEFFASLPGLFKPFVIGLNNLNLNPNANHVSLRAVCVGYVTVEKNPLKQMLTRRAIIIGGPALADDCTDEEVFLLMDNVRCTMHGEAIYIETRNFNDYSKWKGAFKKAGFEYLPHLNFHIDTSSEEVMMSNLGKSRKRDIRTSFRDGAEIVDSPTIDDVRDWHGILKELYTTKVKTPLFPWVFFEKLHQSGLGIYRLVRLKDDIIGGTLCVGLKNKALYEWFACGKDGIYKNIYPSTVATFAGMKWGGEYGYPLFDMMGAGKPEEGYGVRDFKAKFGGELVEHGRYQCICNTLLYKIGELGVKILKMVK